MAKEKEVKTVIERSKPGAYIVDSSGNVKPDMNDAAMKAKYGNAAKPKEEIKK